MNTSKLKKFNIYLNEHIKIKKFNINFYLSYTVSDSGYPRPSNRNRSESVADSSFTIQNRSESIY